MCKCVKQKSFLMWDSCLQVFAFSVFGKKKFFLKYYKQKRLPPKMLRKIFTHTEDSKSFIYVCLRERLQVTRVEVTHWPPGGQCSEHLTGLQRAQRTATGEAPRTLPSEFSTRPRMARMQLPPNMEFWSWKNYLRRTL